MFRLLRVGSPQELNRTRNPEANAEGGRAFANFLVSPEVQALIRAFGVKDYGQPLFVPAAGMDEPQ